jgi:hypothetical protein
VKRLLLALAVAALVLPAAARAGTSFGVTEDAGKYSADGGAAFFAHLRDLGMSENAVSVQWDPDRPTTIIEKALLDRLVPAASRQGIRIVFAVYFTRPNAVSTTPGGAAHFAEYLRVLARAYPQVKDFIVGNEPNYGVFWQPQFDRTGGPVAGAAYEDLLARSYDSLKSVDPRIQVIGLGLAPRGNDRPFSRSPSTSPVLFLRDVGRAYRRSGRARPLMDSLAYHPYPASSLNRTSTTQGWPSAGVADLSRIKQAVWDAFHDTAQTTFETGLTMKITEIGWQVAVGGAAAAAYRGAENVRTTDEATQAQIYAQLVRELSCDPAVTDVLFFHLVDESDLRGFQSGMIRADGSVRPSYAAVRSAIAASAGGCAGAPRTWAHTDGVVGATAAFASGPGFTVSAQEGAVYRAALVRVDGSLTEGQLAALRSSLASSATTGQLNVYLRAAPELAAPADSGTYVRAVLLSSITEPGRTSLLVSPPFTVGGSTTADSTAGSAAKPAPVDQSSSKPLEPSTQSIPAGSPGSPTTPSAPSTTPSVSTFVVTPQAQAPARPAAPGPVFKATVKRSSPPAVRTSAAFQRLPKASARKPGVSKLAEPDPAPKRQTARAVAPPALDSHKRGPMTMFLLAALLAGAAIAAVVSVRLLGR